MKIAVNTRLLIPGKLEGIGWFSFETMRRICMQHPEHEFFFIFDRAWDAQFIFAPNVTPIVLSPQARHPVLYYIWFGFRLPALLRELKPDLFLTLDGYLPLTWKGKTLAVFYDLNFEHYPADLPRSEQWFYRHFFPRYARKADRIATISEYSKSDIHKMYGIDKTKIDLVYCGVNEAYAPVTPAVQQAMRDKHTGGSPFFLFVGSLHPRKNIARLFRAYDIFREKHPGDVKLLIIGAKKWWTPDIRETYDQMQYKTDVIFTGRLSTEELLQVMASALALTYVSYFEGFGIPILEAFAAHTPVITSNVTSMPEVAGDAAMIVDPMKEDDIADAMLQMASDPGLRQSLIEKGAQRVRDFSWDKTAALLYQSILQTLD